MSRESAVEDLRTASYLGSSCCSRWSFLVEGVVLCPRIAPGLFVVRKTLLLITHVSCTGNKLQVYPTGSLSRVSGFESWDSWQVLLRIHRFCCGLVLGLTDPRPTLSASGSSGGECAVPGPSSMRTSSESRLLAFDLSSKEIESERAHGWCLACSLSISFVPRTSFWDSFEGDRERAAARLVYGLLALVLFRSPDFGLG